MFFSKSLTKLDDLSHVKKSGHYAPLHLLLCEEMIVLCK